MQYGNSQVENFKKMCDHQKNALEWFNLIGDVYHGGGGGVGQLRKLTLLEVEVYHQYSNGAKNYHDIPDELKLKLEKVIKNNFPKLITEALEMIETEKKELAQKAKDEHKQLMIEAGLMDYDA